MGAGGGGQGGAKTNSRSTRTMHECAKGVPCGGGSLGGVVCVWRYCDQTSCISFPSSIFDTVVILLG